MIRADRVTNTNIQGGRNILPPFLFPGDSPVGLTTNSHASLVKFHTFYHEESQPFLPEKISALGQR
jgi:hypothetical protein